VVDLAILKVSLYVLSSQIVLVLAMTMPLAIIIMPFIGNDRLLFLIQNLIIPFEVHPVVNEPSLITSRPFL
jgi:hypothetical protein